MKMKIKGPDKDVLVAVLDSILALICLFGLIAILAVFCGCIADDSQTVNDCDNTGHDGQCWVFGVGNAKGTL